MSLVQTRALFKKDFLTEFRTKETLTLQFCMSLLLATIVSVGANSTFLTHAQVQQIFPMLIWVIFIFSATVSISRSYEYEFQNAAIEGLVLTGVSPWLIFISKFISNCIVVLIGHLISFFVLALLLNMPIIGSLGGFFLVSVAAVIGYCAISTLLTPVSLSSRLKGMLLPLILLPLLFPLLFAALEITTELFQEGHMDYESIWASLLIGFDVIYFTLAINLFDHVIKE